MLKNKICIPFFFFIRNKSATFALLKNKADMAQLVEQFIRNE